MNTELSKIEPKIGEYQLPNNQMYLGVQVLEMIITPKIIKKKN